MKLEQNEKPLLFSETTIPDIFFSEHLSELPGDYLKIYLYMTIKVERQQVLIVLAELVFVIFVKRVTVYLMMNYQITQPEHYIQQF